MHKSLVLLVITLSGAHFAVARRNHGRRFDHNRFIANLGGVNKDDRGDEFRELNGSLAAKEQEAKIAGQQETHIGYNSHIVVSTPPSRVEDTANLRGAQKDFTSVVQESSSVVNLESTLNPVRGYGFKFSAVVPEDIRYTFEKNRDQHDSVSFIEQAELSAAFGDAKNRPDSLEGLHQDAVIQFDPRPAFDPELPIYNVNNQEPIMTEAPYVVHANNEASYEHGGLNIGSGLTSIAQGSADRAQSAVVGQQVAAQQAVFIAKNGLAQSAIHSAATAIAALAGKEVLVNALQKENEEVQKALNYEIDQLQVTKKTTSTARHAAQQAAYHVSVLAAALNNAQQVVEQAEANEKSAAAELASQQKMVGDAKGRLSSIIEQLKGAHIDFEATKDAATKATEAAEKAQLNAHLVGQHGSHVFYELNSEIDHHQRTPSYTLSEE